MLSAVGKIYGGRRALHDVSARFEPGRVAAVLGPNGAGKTTLLGILSTLVSPSSGAVRWGDEPLGRGSPSRAHIGYVGHDPGLYVDLTARENLKFFCALHGCDATPARVDRLLARVGLADVPDDATGADVFARHAAAAGAGARARPRSGAAAVRRAVGGARSGGRGLAADGARRRAHRRAHGRAGDARPRSDRGDRRPGA